MFQASRLQWATLQFVVEGVSEMAIDEEKSFFKNAFEAIELDSDKPGNTTATKTDVWWTSDHLRRLSLVNR